MNFKWKRKFYYISQTSIENTFVLSVRVGETVPNPGRSLRGDVEARGR